MIHFITDKETKKSIASAILNQLPEWFGLPDSTHEYINSSQTMPFWAAYKNDTPVGFITLKETSQYSAEIYVMGVLKECHQQGIGTMLWEAFLNYAKANGYEIPFIRNLDFENWNVFPHFGMNGIPVRSMSNIFCKQECSMIWISFYLCAYLLSISVILH